MKIYLIKHDEIIFDANLGHVIVANNTNEVRGLAIKASVDEGENIWNMASVTEEGAYSGTNTEPFILLSNFYSSG
ncbi:MAG: hypothetical protein QM504_17260 [Pseudomonadota bacterium]